MSIAPQNVERAAERAAGHVVLTQAQARARRQRNIAIGLAITFLCVLFYVITLAKMGAMFVRPS